MCAKWTHWAAAAVLSMTAASPALAGSATQPGDTMGSASGAQTPPGFYFSNQTNWGCSNTSPRTCVLTNIPIFIWSTPWEILGGKLAFATAPTTWVKLDLKNTYHTNDLFNPWAGGQLTWDLGRGWGFTYLLGAYFDVNSGSSVAYSSTSLNQRFGLSYTADGWNLTANAILGINFDEVTHDPQGFPCPTEQDLGCNPNFFNVDLTATKRFGKWELGAVGFYATDINKPISDYRKQSKSAVGGLVGYSFRVAKLQVYATTELHQEHYGGKDTRIWSRITFPLGNPPALRQSHANQQAAGPLAESYRRPAPLLNAGQKLAEDATAMTDVSDGLLLDARRLAEASGCCAEIDLDALAPGGTERAEDVAVDATLIGSDF